MIRLYLWFCRVLFCCTRTMGAVGTRPSLRPLYFRGRFLQQLGRIRAARTRSRVSLRCHAPRKRGIQYAAALWFKHQLSGIQDCPVKPGDDTERVAI
jgi:hypothetical protein